jgi:hypothetical protein
MNPIMKPQTESTIETEEPLYSFSSRELHRLAAYRKAIVAGFYTDLVDLVTVPSSPALDSDS